MAVRQGSVLAVNVIPHAGSLLRDTNAGATFLRLDRVDTFALNGGSATISVYDETTQISESLTYLSVDPATNIMLLAAPTVNAYPEGTDVIGVGETTVATVDLEDGFEPVRAELSHALKSSTVLAEGQRGRGDVERVLIDEISGRWMLVEVLGKRNLIDGAAIDPTTTIPAESVPDPGPTEPPASSPTITVTPFSRSLNIYASGAQPDIWTVLTYEVALDPAFATIVQSVTTRSSSATIAPTPDRTDLYARVTASNVHGSAPPSPTVGPVRTMLIESVDVADFALNVKKLLSSTHKLY